MRTPPPIARGRVDRTPAMTFNAPKYRIKAVAKLTGMNPATLRAWERRYGLPEPCRTQSSYRMYSDRDVALIQQVKALCEGGMTVSEAAAQVLDDADAPPQPAGHDGDPYAATRALILDSVDRFDPVQLDAAVQRALSLGPATSIYEHVFRPVLVEIGDRWHRGSFTVGQEHLASQVLESAARQMLRLIQPPSSAPKLVLGCFADDEHCLPLLGVALLAASDGFHIVMLGARTPPAAIRQAVRELGPAAVGLSATLVPPPHEARALIDAYADACGNVPWLVGGRAAPSLQAFIESNGGIVAAEGGESALLRTLHRLPRNPVRD